MSNFSNKLRAAIENSGIPIGVLAEQSGMSASMLYKIQSGSRLPDSLETLETLLESMACALPQKQELLQTYKIERIGIERYQSFQALKELLADLTVRTQAVSYPVARTDLNLPSAVIGSGNVNAAVYTLLARETMRPGGKADLMVPMRYRFCAEALPQILMECHPEFVGIRHLFVLKASGGDDALLYNMERIRSALPGMLNMPKYHPWYCYLPEPDNGTLPFPYYVATSEGILLLDSDLQSGVFMRDPEVCELYRRSFARLSHNFMPMLHTAPGDIHSYCMTHRSIVSSLNRYPVPVTLAAEPCILPCISQKAAARYLPADLLENPEIQAMITEFFEGSAVHGYTTFFTMYGVERLIKTGVIMEMRGRGIPRFCREDILDALEEMLRRTRQGTVKLHLFRHDIFQGDSRVSLGLYENKLFTGCEMPGRGVVFSDITEGTLARVLRDYTDNALLLGDVFSTEESAQRLEREIRRYRNGAAH